MIPSWLEKYLSESDIQDIEKSIAEAEKKTSGEIVPIIVHRSSTVGHVPIVIFGFGLLLYYMLGIAEFLSEYLDGPWWSVVLWMVLWGATTRVLSRWSVVQRALVSRIDREYQAEQRAMNEFYKAELNNTKGSTGILLFISILDHQAVVLGDKAISEKLDEKIWGEVIELLVGGIKSRKMSEGLCQAIEKCGQILTPHFPIEAGDTNELANKLIIKE